MSPLDKSTGVFAAIVLAGAVAMPAVAQSHLIVELPPLPGHNWSFGTGMNDAGVVVGQSRDSATGQGRATRWINGVPEDLGTLSGWVRALPLDISSDGTRIVGEALKAGRWIPFIWENGVLTELPGPGTAFAGGWQINDAGIIVGRAADSASSGLAALRWEKVGGAWTLTLLPSLPGARGALAAGINNAGVIVGASGDSLFAQIEAVRWDGTSVSTLPGLAGMPGLASGINDAGQSTGFFEVSPGGPMHAFYHDGTAVTDLGTLIYPNSYGHRINGNGTIVGQSYANGSDPVAFPDPRKRAFVWRAGTMTAINDLIPAGTGWNVVQLEDLNESGQMVGFGQFSRQWRACLIIPCYPDCDQSTGAGVLDIFDFLCFQTRFVNGEPYACECDPDPVCNIFDFLCFQTAFVTGCP